MNYFMIYLSIFSLGVTAGLVLSHLITHRHGPSNRRLKKWKGQF